ncbi:MAG TPA: flagellar hook-length control protein FliK [Methylomusa anaerophila]|uniref:Flagellar hook-length control protein FliK n=1 Tax=Methylomusa anaerophila TaxID=1930071 RepID=A0A348AQ34_9FIRM|nr:flagellar hook-length control protein FliK [Methylomusa anaerophila]BBB93182.1 flagellar hook-length control protein FliK [Methylomusa anaerophila]HML86986.1 flagellar hook-length control protein FliK [Methylomusa anaerophila]
MATVQFPGMQAPVAATNNNNSRSRYQSNPQDSFSERLNHAVTNASQQNTPTAAKEQGQPSNAETANNAANSGQQQAVNNKPEEKVVTETKSNSEQANAEKQQGADGDAKENNNSSDQANPAGINPLALQLAAQIPAGLSAAFTVELGSADSAGSVQLNAGTVPNNQINAAGNGVMPVNPSKEFDQAFAQSLADAAGELSGSATTGGQIIPQATVSQTASQAAVAAGEILQAALTQNQQPVKIVAGLGQTNPDEQNQPRSSKQPVNLAAPTNVSNSLLNQGNSLSINAASASAAAINPQPTLDLKNSDAGEKLAVEPAAMSVNEKITPIIAAAKENHGGFQDTLGLSLALPNADGSDAVSPQNPHTFSFEATLQNYVSETAASAENSVVKPTTKDDYQVMNQIVQQAKLINRPNNPEMIIKLKPEHLGELILKISVDSGVVTASFHSNNAEVRSIIESSLPQLKQDLANSGLKVDNVSVYAGLNEFLPNNGRSYAQQQFTFQPLGKKQADELVETVESGIVSSGPSSPDAGIDYRV